MAKKSKTKAAKAAASTGSYRLQVRLPEAWRVAVEAAAELAGVDVSTFVRDAVHAKLPRETRAGLPGVKVGRPLAE